MTDLHCGRLDPHTPHHWHIRPTPSGAPRRDYECPGPPLIEGGWADWDLEDDQREHELDRERREIA